MGTAMPTRLHLHDLIIPTDSAAATSNARLICFFMYLSPMILHDLGGNQSTKTTKKSC